MSWRSLSRLLGAVSLLCAVTGVSILIWSMGLPLSVTPPNPENSVIPAENGHPKSRPPLQVKDFQFVWNKPLRRPLVDRPAAASPPRAAVPAGPKTALRLQLVGTMVESGQRWALLQLASGEIKLLRQGQVYDDAIPSWTLLEVDADHIVVEAGGREHTFALKLSDVLAPLEPEESPSPKDRPSLSPPPEP